MFPLIQSDPSVPTIKIPESPFIIFAYLTRFLVCLFEQRCSTVKIVLQLTQLTRPRFPEQGQSGPKWAKLDQSDTNWVSRKDEECPILKLNRFYMTQSISNLELQTPNKISIQKVHFGHKLSQI